MKSKDHLIDALISRVPTKPSCFFRTLAELPQTITEVNMGSTNTKKPYAIPEGSTILVTAANSYIGSNVVDHLLELGFHVRGTVRAEKPWLNELFEKKYGKDKFETVIVTGAEVEGAFDGVLDGVAGIVHVVCSSQFGHRFQHAQRHS